MAPSKLETMYQRAEKLNTDKKRYAGEALSDDEPQGIAVSGSLAEALKLEPGSLVLLAAPTLEGNANAVDAEVRQVAQNLAQGAAARLISIPLEWAQELAQTGGVAQVCVLLEERGDLAVVQEELMAALEAKGLELESQKWSELSTMYTLTKNMFDIIFGVVFAILIVIVSMSVMNTIGMAVMERTSEIGTLHQTCRIRDRIIEGRQDEIFEHLNVFRVNRARSDTHGKELAAARHADPDRAATCVAFDFSFLGCFLLGT
jgi:putative ABC transport system permease protein